MSNLRDYYNKVTNDGRIFSLKDVMDIPAEEDAHYKDALDYQAGKIGFPTDSELSSSDDVVYVHSYSRDDGTKVRAHYRSKNGHSFSDPNRKPLGTPTEAKADLDARIDKWMNNKIEGTPTGGAAGVDYFIDAAKKKVLSSEAGPLLQLHAAKNQWVAEKLSPRTPLSNEYYRISATNGNSIKKTDINNMKTTVGEVAYSNPALYEHLRNMSGNRRIVDWDMVVIPKSMSPLVEAVKKSSPLQEKVVQNIEKIGRGDLKNSSILDLDMRNVPDVGTVLGRTHIYDPKIDDKGNLNMYVIDWYDFDKMPKSNDIITIGNNNAYEQQENFELSNYALVIPVSYTPEEIGEILENRKIY